MNHLIEQLVFLRESMIEAEQRYRANDGDPHTNHTESQRNLLHYLALRNHDLRPLQKELAALGLSSLGRVEAHALASIDAVLNALRRMDGNMAISTTTNAQTLDFDSSSRLLDAHSRELLGDSPPRRAVRIMVTLPSEAESDYTLIQSLLQQGMEIARINCAHDSPEGWVRMIRHIRRAEKAQPRNCRILMDLGGPKLRTGPVEGEPTVMKVRPKRNAFGAVVRPARIWLTGAKKPTSPPAVADASIPVSPEWIRKLEIGDRISFKDARTAEREMTVVDIIDEGCWAEMLKSAYLTPGIPLARRDANGGRKSIARIANFPPKPGSIDLKSGDVLDSYSTASSRSRCDARQRRRRVESCPNFLHIT